MYMTEGSNRLTLEQSLINKAEVFGLSSSYVKELPLGIKK